MSTGDTSGVSLSPPSPSFTDSIIKMIQNNKMKIINVASLVLVLIIFIIIIITATTTKTEDPQLDAEALNQKVGLVFIR